MDNVLVVDDDPQVRHLLQKYLEAAGYGCRTANDVATARDILKADKFELILSDINMPGESGIDLIHHVKQFHPDTAIVMVSVIENPEEAKAALELGVYGYIVKPFTRNLVLISVDNALRRHRLELQEKEYQQMLEVTVKTRTAELYDQLSFMQTLTDAIPNPIYYKNARGVYLGCNHAFEVFFGKSRDAIIGRNAHDVIDRDLADIFSRTDKKLLEDGGRQVCEATALSADGIAHEVIVSKAAYADKNGNTGGVVGVILDITEKMALERELRQAQKLESIGQLAAGIAHEINTPIQYVGDNTRFLKDAFDDLTAAMTAYDKLLTAANKQAVSDDIIADVKARVEEADLPYLSEEIPSAIEQSLEGVQRVSKIIRAMREFSHPGTDRKVAVALNQALESTITVARNEWKYVAEMKTDFDADMPTVPCFPGEMNQVFLNLIINASHAISDVTDGGRLGKGNITVSTQSSDDAVSIRIGDTGGGIPESVQSRIFDPFFTTKAVGKGTGQGLAIARSVVVDKHGGTLRFDTESGKGTTFIIQLPVGDPPEATDAASEEQTVSA